MKADARLCSLVDGIFTSDLGSGESYLVQLLAFFKVTGLMFVLTDHWADNPHYIVCRGSQIIADRNQHILLSVTSSFALQ